MSSPYSGQYAVKVGVGVGFGVLGGIVALAGLGWMGRKLFGWMRARRDGWERERIRSLDARVKEQRELEELERRVWRREMEVDRMVREMERGGGGAGEMDRWRVAKVRAEQLLEGDIQQV